MFSEMSANIEKIIIIVAVVVLLVTIIKYPVGKIILSVVGGVGLFVLTAYCIINLNVYYTASGGIFGKILDVVKVNNVVTLDNFTHSLKNVVLTQENGDTYSATLTVDGVALDLSTDKMFSLLINKSPCNMTGVSSDFISADYRYIFIDKNLAIKYEDILHIRLAFYTDSIEFYLYTDKGAEATKYWNYYFNKNDFIVTLEEGVYSPNNNIPILRSAKFYDGDVLIKQFYDVKDTTIDLTFENPATDGYLFDGWCVGDKVYTPEELASYTLTNNVEFTAKWTKIYTVTYTEDLKLMPTSTGIISNENKVLVCEENAELVFDVYYYDYENATFSGVDRGQYREEVHIDDETCDYYLECLTRLGDTYYMFYSTYYISVNSDLNLQLTKHVYTATLTFLVRDNTYYTVTATRGEEFSKYLPDDPVLEGFEFQCWQVTPYNWCDFYPDDIVIYDKTFTAIFLGKAD